MKNIIKIKAILSSLLLITFLIVSFSGLGLFFAPSGRIAKTENWNFLGFDKWRLEKMHTVWGFVMVALILIHLGLNYKIFLGELKSLFKTRSSNQS